MSIVSVCCAFVVSCKISKDVKELQIGVKVRFFFNPIISIPMCRSGSILMTGEVRSEASFK